MSFQLSDKAYLDEVILSAKDQRSLGLALGSVMAYFRLGKFDGCFSIYMGYLNLLLAISCRVDAPSSGLSMVLFDRVISSQKREVENAFDEYMGFLFEEAG
jgi:hypothetical protein